MAVDYSGTRWCLLRLMVVNSWLTIMASCQIHGEFLINGRLMVN